MKKKASTFFYFFTAYFDLFIVTTIEKTSPQHYLRGCFSLSHIVSDIDRTTNIYLTSCQAFRTCLPEEQQDQPEPVPVYQQPAFLLSKPEQQ